MSEELYPTFDIPVEVEQEKEFNYRNYSCPLFDMEKGDFVFDSAGKINTATEQEMFMQWCLKACHVMRFSKIAYSNSYGAEIDRALQEPTRAAKESYLQRTITDAILADPYQRAINVTAFKFEWSEDSVEVTFEIIAVDDLGGIVSVKYAT
jgi:hypothetical protein